MTKFGYVEKVTNRQTDAQGKTIYLTLMGVGGDIMKTSKEDYIFLFYFILAGYIHNV